MKLTLKPFSNRELRQIMRDLLNDKAPAANQQIAIQAVEAEFKYRDKDFIIAVVREEHKAKVMEYYPYQQKLLDMINFALERPADATFAQRGYTILEGKMNWQPVVIGAVGVEADPNEAEDPVVEIQPEV